MFSRDVFTVSLFGVLSEFDPSTELFTAYLERLEEFLIANSIEQCSADASQEVATCSYRQGKVAVFISVSFSKLCDKLKDHYKPKRLEVAEMYRFHQCVQEENESVSAYSARLRRSLRDQFICGIRNSATRKNVTQ